MDEYLRSVADVVLDSSEFNFSATLVKQPTDLLPASWNSQPSYVYLNVYLSLSVFTAPEKPQWGVANYVYIFKCSKNNPRYPMVHISNDKGLAWIVSKMDKAIYRVNHCIQSGLAVFWGGYPQRTCRLQCLGFPLKCSFFNCFLLWHVSVCLLDALPLEPRAQT